MANYVKNGDAWVEATQRPFIKMNGVWYPAKETLVKDAGVWKQTFEYDVTPSSSPTMSLQVMFNRYIRIGLRLPGGHDPDLKRIRLLSSRTGPVSTQFGAGFHHTADIQYPKEPWSDWYYNGQNPAPNGTDHGVSNVEHFKQFPVNPTADTNLPGGQFYYFGAWSEDKNGNWSAGTYSKIWMPKQNADPSADTKIVREARITPKDTGSAGLNGVSYTSGRLLARESPRSNGFWFYDNQITAAVGEKGAPTVKSAKIRITRAGDSDQGQPTANVRLFWHKKNGPEEMPMLDENMHDITKVGTINKGETKWFDIPESYWPKFNTELKGMGIVWGNQASDYLMVQGKAADPRSGEVNIIWDEQL